MKSLIFAALVFVAPASQAASALWFTSSPSSWVGQGQTFFVQPSDDYLFEATVNADYSVHILVASFNSPFGPDWDPGSGDEYHYWMLDLAAPFDDPLEVGLYEDTARWPFQDFDQPGMTFSGDHRGNNRNTGFFEILEIAFDANDNLASLAVDFTQFGELNPDWWIHGSLRYNSDVAVVPVPAALWLMLSAISALAATRRTIR